MRWPCVLALALGCLAGAAVVRWPAPSLVVAGVSAAVAIDLSARRRFA